MPFGFFSRKPAAPSLPAGLRAYAVGDVHGRLDLLTEMLTRIREDNAARPPADTRVVLLGDLIDRGPDSAGVVDLAMRPLDFASLTVLQGNHEAMMLQALAGDAAATAAVPIAISARTRNISTRSISRHHMASSLRR